jgi:hypothetical protein
LSAGVSSGSYSFHEEDSFFLEALFTFSFEACFGDDAGGIVGACEGERAGAILSRRLALDETLLLMLELGSGFNVRSLDT